MGRRHFLKESLRLLDVAMGVVVVPVNDHVNAEVNGRFHHPFDFLLLSFRMRQVSAGLNGHGRADHRAMPVIAQPSNRVGVVELSHPLAPEQRHPAQDGRPAGFINDSVALHAQPSMPLDHTLLRSTEWGQ
jgi:hypothetical protein